MRRLTTKQRKFSDNYIQSGNATQSAIKAGYSKRSARQIGNRLLSKDYIKRYVNSKLNRMSNSTIASASEIMKYYTDVLRGKVTEDVVIGTPDGEIRDKKAPDIHDRTEVAKELMKRYAPIEKAKTKKLVAEANIRNNEYKENNSSQNRELTQTERILDIMERAGKVQHSKQSTRKLRAETKIKELFAKHADTKDNSTVTKLDNLLSAIFDDKDTTSVDKSGVQHENQQQ